MKTFEIREGDGNDGCYSRGTIEAKDAFHALELASRRGMINRPYDVVLKRDINGDEQSAYVASFVRPIFGDACRWCAESHLVTE